MCGKKASARFVFLAGFGLSLVFAACVSGGLVPGSGLTGARQPDWVRDPYTKYSRQAYVAAVGSAGSREAAEKSALANLVSIFGQSVQVDEKLSTSYREAMESGVSGWSESIGIDTGITTSASLDSLVGAEIADTWNDGANGFYAAAVLNKAKAAQIYTGKIQSSLDLIDNLVNIPPEEKHTLGALARYYFAATVADITTPYVNLLAVIGAPGPAVKSGSDYRLEAFGIAQAIPVALRVRNDRAGRIRGAFAKALAGLGFASDTDDSGGTGNSGGVGNGANTAGGAGNSGGAPPYLLDVRVVTMPVEIAGNSNKFTRVELEANLEDAASGAVLLPFTFNSREGHLTQPEADNRAYTAAERAINADYAAFFSDYLSRLLPKK